METRGLSTLDASPASVCGMRSTKGEVLYLSGRYPSRRISSSFIGFAKCNEGEKGRGTNSITNNKTRDEKYNHKTIVWVGEVVMGRKMRG